MELLLARVATAGGATVDLDRDGSQLRTLLAASGIDSAALAALGEDAEAMRELEGYDIDRGG